MYIHRVTSTDDLYPFENSFVGFQCPDAFSNWYYPVDSSRFFYGYVPPEPRTDIFDDTGYDLAPFYIRRSLPLTIRVVQEYISEHQDFFMRYLTVPEILQLSSAVTARLVEPSAIFSREGWNKILQQNLTQSANFF